MVVCALELFDGSLVHGSGVLLGVAPLDGAGLHYKDFLLSRVFGYGCEFGLLLPLLNGFVPLHLFLVSQLFGFFGVVSAKLVELLDSTQLVQFEILLQLLFVFKSRTVEREVFNPVSLSQVKRGQNSFLEQLSLW